MNHYSYHDTDDQTTQEFIRQRSPYEDYWAKSEELALKQASKFLVKPKSLAVALDAGCGEGRLIPWLSHFTNTIDAIDPDPKRLKIASGLVEMTNKDTVVEYHVSSVLEINDEQRYDIILCSHIIQHVTTDNLKAIVNRLRSLLVDGGVLILTFSKASKSLIAEQKLFSTERLIDGRLLSVGIDEATFNRTVLTGGTDMLPVHYIQPQELISCMVHEEWDMKLAWSFHAVDDGTNINGNDEYINSSEKDKIDYGRDMLMVWQRGQKD